MSADSLAGQAHLYLAAPEDWTGGARLNATLAPLSTQERERYERFRVPAPARAFVTGRALARRVLSLYADAEPRDWRLEPDEHGRPRIIAPATGGLDFNLSHNDRLVACVVTGGAACGVDVESPERRVECLRIAEHSFGEVETLDLKRREGVDRRRRFFAYWTLKEAYLKARGRGIAMRMDSAIFRFTPEGGRARIEVEFAARVDDRPDRWRFALYRTDGDQLLALALRRQGDGDGDGDGDGELEIRSYQARPDEPRAAPAPLETVAASLPVARARG